MHQKSNVKAGAIITSRILNFGSLNIDYVYSVEQFVSPGETLVAHDRFTSFFISEWSHGVEVEQALMTACRAAAICVSRPGAADSIPTRAELLE